MNFLFLAKQEDCKNSENHTTLHQSGSGLKLKLKHPNGQMTHLQDLKDCLNAPAESLHNSRLRTIVHLDKQSIMWSLLLWMRMFSIRTRLKNYHLLWNSLVQGCSGYKFPRFQVNSSTEQENTGETDNRSLKTILKRLGLKGLVI